MKTSNVYDPEAFAARVNYAAQCLVRGIRSRRADTCFEMNDGRAVITALVRRSMSNPTLKAAIAKGWADLVDGIPANWAETARQFDSVPTKDLSQLARQLRQNTATPFAHENH